MTPRWHQWTAAVLAAAFAWVAYAYLTLPDVRPLVTTNPSTTAFMDLRAREARAARKTPRHDQRWVAYRRISPALTRAVLLAHGPQIEEFAIRLPDGQPMSATPEAQTARSASLSAEAATRGFVGQTVSAVEQQLIIDTLSHCLGNRTHAANILGISIRTLRNKLKEYSEAGIAVPAPQGAGANAA